MTGALILAVMVAMSPVAPAPAPPVAFVPTVAATMHVERAATVMGRVVGIPAYWPSTTVWLAAYMPLSDDGASGVWVLEPSLAPQAVVGADGAFAIANVPAGRWCIVYGYTPEDCRVVGPSWRRARVYVVRPHGVLDVGTVGLW